MVTTQQRSLSYCVGLWMVLSIAGCNQSHSIEALAISQATNHSPMLLRVIVQAHLADGTKREFSVDLLHTTLLENTVSPSTLNEVPQ
jgi:hypothetical protein